MSEEEQKPEIKIESPMDWHPANYEARVEAMKAHPSAEAIARDAAEGVRTMYDNFSAMVQAGQAAAKEALDRGETRKAYVRGKFIPIIPSDLHERFHAAAGKAFDRAATRNQAAIDSMDRHAERLDAEIGQALAGPEKHGSEIRSYLRSLSKPKRLEAVMAAVSAGDRETLTAISSGPAYLSGLDAKEVALHREHAAKSWAPAAYAARQEAGQMRERLSSAAMSFGRKAAELKERYPTAAREREAQSKLDELEGLA